jgi:hypothetical protein
MSSRFNDWHNKGIATMSKDVAGCFIVFIVVILILIIGGVGIYLASPTKPSLSSNPPEAKE